MLRNLFKIFSDSLKKLLDIYIKKRIVVLKVSKPYVKRITAPDRQAVFLYLKFTKF